MTEAQASVIITAHDEGDEVLRTIASVVANTRMPLELIVVDDASTDGCCNGLMTENTMLIRHTDRVGVAASRHEATEVARSGVFVFLDAHQRVSKFCIDHLAAIACRRNAIVWPDVRCLHDRKPIAHGASFDLCPDHGYFRANWRTSPPRSCTTRITSLMAPGYAIPRQVYDRVRWPAALRGWGGSEAAVSLKAFFTDVPILHACGPLARHLFKQDFQYPVDSAQVWRNQAIIARVCFDDRSWFQYWYPCVFRGNLTQAVEAELAADEVLTEQREFSRLKKRSDDEFWYSLLDRQPPPCWSN